MGLWEIKKSTEKSGVPEPTILWYVCGRRGGIDKTARQQYCDCMAREIFDMTAADLLKLRRVFKNSPKLARRATATVLTQQAFGTRRAALQEIHGNMTVRNQQFVVSRVRYNGAKGNQPLQSQFSEVGSISTNRFTAWNEQETGANPARTRVANTLARGGSKSGQIRPRFRLKPGKDFLSQEDFNGTNDQRFAALLRKVTSENYTKPFIINRHRKFKPGLYLRRRKKIYQLQEFGNRRRNKPQRFTWMKNAREQYVTNQNNRQLWGRAFEKHLTYTKLKR